MTWLGNKTRELAEEVAQVAAAEADELNRRQIFLALALLREAADLLERPLLRHPRWEPASLRPEG